MRETINIDSGWLLSVNSSGEAQINLPCIKHAQSDDMLSFRKEITVPQEKEGQYVFLEIAGVSGKVHIYSNDEFLLTHDGCSAVFRVMLSSSCKEGEKFEIKAAAEPRPREDGNFVFGKAKLIYAEKSHFCLDDCGSDGIYIDTALKNGKAEIKINSKITNPNNYDVISFTVTDPLGSVVSSKTAKPTEGSAHITLENAAPWGGPQDAEIYMLKAQLLRDSTILDEIEIPFGIKKFEIQKNGFFCINGIRIPLNGASFSDCRAVKSDRKLFAALDANAVMISSLPTKSNLLYEADKSGTVFWYNAPYTGDENDFTELYEFIKQNKNHPSLAFICCNKNADEKYRKNFIKLIKENSDSIFSVLLTDINDSENVPQLGADVCALCVNENTCSGSFIELSGKYSNLREKFPDAAFAVVAEPEKQCENEMNFSEWNEKLWKTFSREKGVIAFFAGYIADGGEDSAKKGLYDNSRKNAKDSFWFYKAQFSVRGFVKICGEKQRETSEKRVSIKCYTNSVPVRIVVNGKRKKKYKPESEGDGIYVFKKIKLRKNKNRIEISAGDFLDEVMITRTRAKKIK